MRKIWGLFLAGIVVGAMSGCGGSGAGTSYQLGQYNGTAVQTNGGSLIIDVSIQPQGTVSGTCSITSPTSAAIVATGVLTGTIDPQTRNFTATGMYGSLLPPVPGEAGSGVITVTGTIPIKGVYSGPMSVDRDGIVYPGVISPLPLF